ncbi:hypothetical protein LTR12_018345, partial [Friedmanniomyces endolithicus]
MFQHDAEDNGENWPTSQSEDDSDEVFPSACARQVVRRRRGQAKRKIDILQEIDNDNSPVSRKIRRLEERLLLL